MSTRISAIAALLLLGSAAPAMAGGFYLQEQSARELGRAFSGEAASADNASTVYYNPAGMTELEGINFQLGGELLLVNSRQENRGTTRTIPGIPVSFPVPGGDGGNPFSQPIVVPQAYATAQITDRLWAGLGVSSPFGVVVDYDDDFFGRYDSLRSDVFTVNVQPSLAYKISDNLSIGAGVDVQYIDVELTNAVPNLNPANGDGFLSVKGDDVSVGWNVGAQLEVEKVRLGAHYRSRMKHNLEGTFDLSGLVGPLAGQNGSTTATAPLTLPDIATVSVMFGVDSPTRVYGSWNWYNWSTFDAIRVFPEGRPAQSSPQNYEDSWSMALGAEHDFTDRLTLRAGTMYDETPVPDAFLSTRVPDGDRTWATVGATYRLNDRFDVDFSYAHVFVASATLNRSDDFYQGTPAQINTTLRSTNRGDVDQFGLALNARF